MSMARVAIIFLIAALAAFASTRLLTVAIQKVGPEPGKWFKQAIQIAAALVAYLVAGRVLARIQRRS